MSLVLKLKYRDDIRRITVNSDITFGRLVELTCKLYQTSDQLILKYQDEDNDMITISSDLELFEAMKVHQQTGKQALFLHVFKTEVPTCPSVQPSQPSSQPSTQPSSGPSQPFDFSNISSMFFSPNLQNFLQTNSSELINYLQKFTSSEFNPQKIGEIFQEFLTLSQNSSCQERSCSEKEEVNSTSVSQPAIHHNITCDGCGMTPLTGIRFKCNVCPDYDLCEKCKVKPNIHPGHGFIEISSPKIVHYRVQCDGCGMAPIIGNRFKCNVCPDYDLCESCKKKSGIHDNSHQFSQVAPRYCPPMRRAWGHGHHGRRSSQHVMARFVCDVNLPDGSIVKAGSSFTKIWRLRNESNEVAWPENCQLIFICGDQLSNSSSAYLPCVQPGSEIDIALDLTAPQAPGRYVSYFRLIGPDGQRFGQKIWVDLIVEAPEAKKEEVKKEEVKKEEVKKEEVKKEEVKKEEPKKIPELEMLLDMGFSDEEKLLSILNSVNFDVTRALHILCE